MAQYTQHSTGGLALPTKKRRADGTVVDADQAFNDYVATLPANQRESKDFNVRRYWELNGRPSNFEEAKGKGMFTMDENDGTWHAGTVAYNESADEYEFMKGPDHPTVGKEIEAYNSDDPEMVEFRNNYYLDQTSTPWKYKRRKEDGADDTTPAATVDRHKRTPITQEDVDANPDVKALPAENDGTGQGTGAGGYGDIMNYLKMPQINDADAQKRQRRREMIASIGDAISALSSMYQATQGAPVTYQRGQDMGTEVQKRGDRLAQDRKAMSDQYLNYVRMQRLADQDEENKAYRRDMLSLRREQQEQQEQYRQALLREREIERWRKIANNPGGDVYFDAYKEMLDLGSSEEEAHNVAAQKLAEYNADHNTNYTIGERYDSSGKVVRTVTLRTKDADEANSRITETNDAMKNTPAASTTTNKKKKSSGSKKSSSGGGSSNSNKTTSGKKPNPMR